jgi:acyl-CoA hydrolase
MTAEDLLSSGRRIRTRARFAMIALDASARPTAVPPLDPPVLTKKAPTQ